MKSKILTIALFLATASIVAFYPTSDNNAVAKTAGNVLSKQNSIQIAILLDTSGSMSGLINQTREQLWQIVNEFSKAKRNGVAPKLEVALYEYGNNALAKQNGYIRKLSGFTQELDSVSEALFSLTTNGGDEYCGYVINTAVNELNWSNSNNDIKAIFIAGNEPFTQGPVNFQQAINNAKSKGITVNTIHAGNHQHGANSGWMQGAILAGGEYMSINHNHKVAHINAPQDKKIADLNAKLNKTYVPYGKTGALKQRRQMEQDRKSKAISSGLLAKRAQAKASSNYRNQNWDLVDAVIDGHVKVEEVKKADLPAPMQAMKPAVRKEYIKKQAAERKMIKAEISKLAAERNQYVKEKRKQQAANAPKTVNEALIGAIHKQGKKKQYEFK